MQFNKHHCRHFSRNNFFYDVFGRQTVSGIWRSASLPALDNLVVKTGYTGTGTLAGHTVNLTLPQVELMTVNYYDDHAFTSGVTQLDYVTPPAGYGSQFTSAKGLLTGTRTYRLGDPSRYTVSALYYDYRERVVQSHTSNHLGGFDDEYFGYTFTGKVMQHQLVHSAPGKTTQTEVYAYDYGTPATNPTERLLAVTHKLNNSVAVTLAQYTYDEVGRVQTKKLATETSSYSYNVRSWLTGIAGTGFNQTLAYNGAVNGITPTKALYNGNIGAVKWKAGDETTERGYKFSYDGLNRLTAAAYGEGASLTSSLNRFNEAVIEYDKAGNIKALERQGKLDSGYGMMDNLTYTYTGNKLTKVTDAVTAPITYANAFHFVDRANVANEYTYDQNGNATKDLNKNITSISYNVLNLPSVITFADGNTITYGYDATGSKLSVAYTAGGTTTKTEYAGNKVYRNGTLSMILTEEGYITLSGTTPTYHYYLKDHQGNNRVVLNQSGAVEQVNHYYPFGGLFGEGIQTINQPYRYNGKELDRELGLDMYDYGARHYDATLGRWITVDPMAEKYYGWNSYAYVGNNPVGFIDPNGMDIWEINNQGKIVNQIKVKNQDAFYMVDKNGNRTYTTDADGNKHYNSISFEYGTITDSKKSGWFRSATSFAVNSESSGAELFKFFADNTKIEYGLINTQSNGSTVMTNHNESSVRASATTKSLSDKGQTVTSVVHNHPNSSNPSGFRKGDTSGDKFAANLLTNSHGYQVERYVYQPRTGNLVAYDEKGVIGSMSWRLIFTPSKARKIPIFPIRQYPGVGLPPP